MLQNSEIPGTFAQESFSKGGDPGSLIKCKSKQMKKLSQLTAGTKAIIRSFENDDIFIKLMEMGCIPGEEIRVEQVAFMGDPISVSVAGYTLSLRLNEAENILVEVVA